MTETPSRGEIIRRGTRGCCYANSIRLHGGEVFVIAKDFDGGHSGVGTAVDDDVVEDVVCSRGFVGVDVVGSGADEFVDEVSGILLVGIGEGFGAHYGGFEAEAEGDGDAFCETSGESFGIVFEIEFGEET